ncbi:MAG: methyltransferase domain-containing protein [Leptospiraceae bacterium]|nr:methyltransferase domain-containing protein [Leptospiraceae bacterium]
MIENNFTGIHENVKEYYSEVLSSKFDLITKACCSSDSLPEYLKPLLANIHDEVLTKFYGCGSPIPFSLEGLTVLDLGCGTGRDSFLISQLVGEEGRVIGVDMTQKQIDVGNNYIDYHTKKFGFKKSNVSFIQGSIENLKELGIEDESIDLVISNCVINLSPDKEAVFKEIYRVLKKGGELYFSDIFSDRRIPADLVSDKVLLGECLGGAMYTEDFRRTLRKVGFLDYRQTSNSIVDLNDREVEKKIGMVNFTSKTIRTFKMEFEDICENYGHVAFYRGGLNESPHRFILDDHHVFEKGLPVAVCGNTALMLGDSRYGKYFEILGNFSTHYGAFDCSPFDTLNTSSESNGGSCC